MLASLTLDTCLQLINKHAIYETNLDTEQHSKQVAHLTMTFWGMGGGGERRREKWEGVELGCINFMIKDGKSTFRP